MDANFRLIKQILCGGDKVNVHLLRQMSLLHTNIIVVRREAEKYQGTGELYVVCNKKDTTKGGNLQWL